MDDLKKYLDASAERLISPDGFSCSCGKHHTALPLEFLKNEKGALSFLPEGLRRLKVRKPFVVMGENGYRAAGREVLAILEASGIPYRELVIPAQPKILPNEVYTGCIEQSFHASCDFILGVGSGVINDLCKFVAFRHSLRTGIVATAPSMDGYASNSSAMELDGVKTTVYTVCPSLILCDTEILRNAPFDMLRSGFGDMAAKIVSVADWRIAHLVTGEYYCENVAQMMLRACMEIVECVPGISTREEKAIRNMTDGLILSGIASSFTGVSRPASGMEHSVSHLLEMFALAKGREPAFHGLQVGYGLRAAFRLYEMASKAKFTVEGCEAASQFDEAAWEDEMKAVFGRQAAVLVENALKEKRNSREAILKRGMEALRHEKEIRQIVSETLAYMPQVIQALDRMEIPALNAPEKLGYSKEEAVNAVVYSNDLRARYIFPSLLSDLGILDRKLIENMIRQ